MPRQISYRWRLRELMAARGIGGTVASVQLGLSFGADRAALEGIAAAALDALTY
ncbi:hypothetical protein [Streptomyces sp. NPDC088348]|uniref:hypothetical protein n=1 Tax=Streptomyces sp. NPDC088348 TaxID=3365853 RepID=UPI0038245AA0